MSGKHTSAPWTVEQDWTWEVKGADGSIVAKFVCVTDAHLGAAAPDLLSAGNLMLVDYQTSAKHHPHHVLVPLAAFDAMRAAIAKATSSGDGR